MTTGNGEDTPISGPTRRLHRDVLDDGEDVTHVSDRQLLMRAVNSTLSTEHNVGMVLAGQARIELRVKRIEERLAPNGEIEQRAQQASVPAFEEAMESVAQRLVAAVHDERDGRGNITPARVREILRDVDHEKDQEATRDRRKYRSDLKIAVIAALVGALAAGLIGEFHGRANAPQQVQQEKRP